MQRQYEFHSSLSWSLWTSILVFSGTLRAKETSDWMCKLLFRPLSMSINRTLTQPPTGMPEKMTLLTIWFSKRIKYVANKKTFITKWQWILNIYFVFSVENWNSKWKASLKKYDNENGIKRWWFIYILSHAKSINNNTIRGLKLK